MFFKKKKKPETKQPTLLGKVNVSNKYGSIVFFPKPEDENDNIYCPYCNAPYNSKLFKFTCGLRIDGGTELSEPDPNLGLGFTAKLIDTCTLPVTFLTSEQMKVHVKHLLKRTEKYTHDPILQEPQIPTSMIGAFPIREDVTMLIGK